MYKRNIISVFFVLTIFSSITMFNTPIVNPEPEPTVSVEPQRQTIVGTREFTINITVQNVEQLYSWQIVLYYNSTMLVTQKTKIIIPEENIFKGQDIQPFGVQIENDTKGTYIVYGASLIGMRPGISGSGLLCQINFTSLANGTSQLTLNETTVHGLRTWLKKSNYPEDIPPDFISPITIVNGEVTVEGIEKPLQPSTITLNVFPEVVDVRTNVTLGGNIDPPRGEVNVTIYYTDYAKGTTELLVTVQTNSSGHYEYNWTADPPYPAKEAYYIYDLYASWPGDEEYCGDTSDVRRLKVNKLGSRITLDINPRDVTSGSIAVISGKITATPPYENVTLTPPYENVTIWYKLEGGNWALLTSVEPDENGTYQYTWHVNATARYAFQAKWPGDKYLRSCESEIMSVGSPQAPPGIMAYLPYIIAAIIIVIVAVAGVYFIKIRKGSK